MEDGHAGRRMLDARHWILDARCWVLDAERGMLKSWMLHAGMPDADMLNAGC